MQTRYLSLLKFLFEKEQWVTASVLSANLEISVRTVKSYIADLNNFYPGIIQSSSMGYHIVPEIAKQVIEKEVKTEIPQTSGERVAYIINRLIKNSVSLPIYDLCDELFISPTTLHRVLPRVRKRLENYDLQLILNSDKLSIQGLEKNKRKLLSSLLYHESNKNFVNLETIQNAFSNIDVLFIKNTILDILNEYHYFINDYSMVNLVLHMAIAIERIKDHCLEKDVNFPLLEAQLHSHEYELSRKVIEKLENHFHITFPENEASETAFLLVSRTTSMTQRSITLDNLEDFIGKKCLDLVKLLIDEIASYYYINLNEPEFFIRFALHIKNLLIRAQTNYFSKNPLVATIKSSCPLIYEIAVYQSGIIKEQTDISINDDEIAYIAFHLGSALEAQKELATKLSVVIYCPTFYNMNHRLYDTLNQRFGTDLMITNIVTEEVDLEKIIKADLIISTVPFNIVSVIPRLQIQPFLTETDIRNIYSKIAEIKAERKRQNFSVHLKQLISPELFERGRFHGTHTEMIHYLCEKLNRYGYVDNTFEAQVQAREQLSSTGFNNFAIPHALKMNAKKTGMFVYLCETPIEWGNFTVSLVIMLCFNREDRTVFNEIFEPLTMILSDHSNFKKAISMPDYKSFIDFLCTCL